jgi:hypothetical protein
VLNFDNVISLQIILGFKAKVLAHVVNTIRENKKPLRLRSKYFRDATILQGIILCISVCYDSFLYSTLLYDLHILEMEVKNAPGMCFPITNWPIWIWLDYRKQCLTNVKNFSYISAILGLVAIYIYFVLEQARTLTAITNEINCEVIRIGRIFTILSCNVIKMNIALRKN